jgi:hypothetical protein
MVMDLEKLRSVRSQIETIGDDFGVLQIQVFGSVARNSAGEESDIDLLVRMEPGRSLLDLIGFEQSVSDLLGRKVDVVTEGGIHPELEPTILREARPL